MENFSTKIGALAYFCNKYYYIFLFTSFPKEVRELVNKRWQHNTKTVLAKCIHFFLPSKIHREIQSGYSFLD